MSFGEYLCVATSRRAGKHICICSRSCGQAAFLDAVLAQLSLAGDAARMVAQHVRELVCFRFLAPSPLSARAMVGVDDGVRRRDLAWGQA